MKKTLHDLYEGRYFLDWLERMPAKIREYNEAEERFLKDRVKGGITLLDVGCGTGRSIEVVLGSIARAIGIDFSKLIIAEAGKRLGSNGRVGLVHANAESIPCTDGSFDLTICMGNTFGNFDNPDRCLGEMLRVTKSSGEVVMGVYAENALETQLEAYTSFGLTVEKFDERAVYTKEGLTSRRYSAEDLRKIAERHRVGMKVTELTSIYYIVSMQLAAQDGAMPSNK